MELNDLNTTERTVSPLRHDLSGRFSRKGTTTKEKKDYSPWIEPFLIIIFMFSVFMSDIMLFVSSLNLSIFSDNEQTSLSLSFSLLTALTLSVITLLSILLFKARKFRSFIAAALVCFIIFVFFKQFAQFKQEITVGGKNIYISLLIGLLFAALTFMVFIQEKLIYKLFSN